MTLTEENTLVITEDQFKKLISLPAVKQTYSHYRVEDFSEKVDNKIVSKKMKQYIIFAGVTFEVDYSTLELSEEEIKLVEDHRRKKSDAEALRAKRLVCQHYWSYQGEWRGESSYQCRLCGETKWE
jgi:hypothetical protein